MADSNVKEWMDAQNAQKQETIAIDMAGSIDLDVLTVPNFLQELEPYLKTDATLIESGNGMQLFAAVITRLQGELGRLDLHSLVEYLCTRLENKETIPNYRAGVKETALSLYALSNMKSRFPKGDASVIAKAVFTMPSSTLRDQKAAGRLALLDLLSLLLKIYSPAVARDLGPKNFVKGLVSMAEFEKDPSCLRVLFQMYEQISQGWDLDQQSFKNIWESYSRYFPITLGGSARDPSLPSPEELKLLLVNCFTSHDNYAKEAIPRLIDMLDTTQDLVTANVKNDVLETLIACVSSYSSPIVSEWSSRIWDALKFEVWDGTNDEFIQRTLSVIQAMTRKLNYEIFDWENLDTPFAQYIKSVSSECSNRLHDAKQQHVLGSGQILNAIASGSHFAFYLVVRNVLPRMIVIWQDLNSKSKRTLLLNVFNGILQARLDLLTLLGGAMRNPTQDQASLKYLHENEATIASSLSNFQIRLVEEVYFDAMTEKDSGEPEVDAPFRVNTIQGLVFLTRLPNFLPDFDKRTIIETLNKISLDKTQKQEIHVEAVSALQQILVEDPNRFRDITLPTFMGLLPERVSSDNKQLKEDINYVLFILDGLLQIACTATCRIEFESGPPSDTTTNLKHRIFDEFQASLLTKLFRSTLQYHNQLPYANAILAAMYRGLELFDKVLEREMADGEAFPPPAPATGPYTWIVMKLYEKFLKRKHHLDGRLAEGSLSYIGLCIHLDKDENLNDMFVSLVGRITTLALRSQQTTPLNNFLFNNEASNHPSHIWNLFCKDSPQDSRYVGQENLQYGPSEKCLTNVLSMSLVAGVRREDKDNLSIQIGDVAAAMIKNATSVENECSAYARVSMLHFLQLLVNKFGATKEKLKNDDRTLLQFMIQLVESCHTRNDDLEVERIYHTLAYFAAACLAALDRSDKVLIENMILGITMQRVGRKVAQSFRILLAPSEIINEHNFCIQRKIRKQRLYEFTVDKIIHMWHESKESAVKENCLIVLAGIFAYMEPKILQEHAVAILPLVLEGTNVSNDDFTQLTCIQIIRDLIPVCPEVIENHLDSVINRMTDQTRNADSSPLHASVKRRAAALDVLALLVMHVEKRVLLRRKARIMVALDVALDDSSRTVRQSAERCKMRWFNLVESKED